MAQQKLPTKGQLYRTESIQCDVLPGGLTILTEEIPHLRSLTLGVWVLRGSRYEPVPQGGMYHCLEHMLFKGTESRDAQTIARLIDSRAPVRSGPFGPMPA